MSNNGHTAQADALVRRGTPAVRLPDLEAGLAVVIGINNYQDNAALQNAVRDARAVGDRLHAEHGFDVRLCIDAEATLTALQELFGRWLPDVAPRYRQILIYFAGHGRSDEDEHGKLHGALLPVDARRGDSGTYLPMATVRDSLLRIVELDRERQNRQILMLLDCCAAGAMGTKKAAGAQPILHNERYQRFLTHRAVQLIASAAHDQLAIDSIALKQDGERSDQAHSPFALAVLAALHRSPANPADKNQDRVLCGTDLYQYIDESLAEWNRQKVQGNRQTPVLFTLEGHQGGEFVFFTADTKPELSLPRAVELHPNTNPYRGLRPYQDSDEDEAVFFGRGRVTTELLSLVEQQPLTIVTGPSGSGKSSLVRAGLVRRQRQSVPGWSIILLRPGAQPLEALAAEWNQRSRAVPEAEPEAAKLSGALLQQRPAALWEARARETGPQRYLFVVDQLEELLTAAPPYLGSTAEAQQRRVSGFLSVLEQVVAGGRGDRVVATLRTGYEQLLFGATGQPDPRWRFFFIPPMNRDDLREVITGPAEQLVLFFTHRLRITDAQIAAPRSLIDTLLDEVERMPGALPLLSVALSSMYTSQLRRMDRRMDWEDYDTAGGVRFSIQRRAEQVYLGRIAEDGGNLPVPIPSPEVELRQATFRRVLLRMVSTRGNEEARRQVRRAELIQAFGNEQEDARVGSLLSCLEKTNLIVSGSFIELAHDALISSWGRLKEWRPEATVEKFSFHHRLADASAAWAQAGSPRALLWRDERIAPLRLHFVPEGAGPLSIWRRIIDYLNPSRVLARIEPFELNQQERRFAQASLRARRNSLLAVLALLTAILAAIGWAVLNLREAQRAKDESVKNVERITIRDATRVVGQSPSNVASALDSALWAYSKHESEKHTHPADDLLGSLTDLAQSSSGLPTAEHALKVGGRFHDVRFTGGEVIAVFSEEDDRVSVLRIHLDGTVTKQTLKDTEYDSLAKVSPDGKWIATSQSGMVRLWDAKTGALARRPLHVQLPEMPSPPIHALAFSADGARIAAGVADQNSEVWGWDTTTGLSLGRIARFPFTIAVLALDGAGKWLAATSSNGVGWEVTLYELASDKAIPIADASGQPASILTLSADGEWLAVGGNDGTVRIWSTSKRESPLKFPGHLGEVTALAFSGSGLRLVSMDIKGTGILWSTSSRWSAPGSARPLIGHPTSGFSSAFDRDEHLVTADRDGGIRIWSVNPHALRLDLAHADAVNSVAVSDDGTRLLTGSKDRTARLFSTATGALLAELGHSTQAITAVAFAPNSGWAVVAGTDRRGRVIAENGTLEAPLDGDQHKRPIRSVAISPKGLIATAADDGTAVLWDRQGHHLATLPHAADPTDVQADAASPYGKEQPRKRLYQVAWSSDGNRLAVAGATRGVSIWAVDSRPQGAAQTRVDLPHQVGVRSVSWSKNGERLLTGADDGIARIWDLRSPSSPPLELRGHAKAIQRASFSATDELVVTASLDGTACIWSTASGERVHVLSGHRDAVHDATFGPNGAADLVATGGEDGRVRIWSARTGRLLAVYHEHSKSVARVLFLPQGDRVVSIGEDAYARVLPARIEQIVDVLCEAHRSLCPESPPVCERSLLRQSRGHGLSNLISPLRASLGCRSSESVSADASRMVQLHSEIPSFGCERR